MDASWLEGSSDGAVAGICRDSKGFIPDGFVQDFQAASTLEAKTLALKVTLEKVKDFERKSRSAGSEQTELSWELESDCLSLMRCIWGEEEGPWALWPVLEECKESLGRLNIVNFSFCPRVGNHVADWLVKAFRRRCLNSAWLTDLPPSLFHLLCLDVPEHLSPSF